jgi:hypothetical protein
VANGPHPGPVPPVLEPGDALTFFVPTTEERAVGRKDRGSDKDKKQKPKKSIKDKRAAKKAKKGK